MKSGSERALTVEHILEFCDGPLLFVAEDEAEAKYICTFLRTTDKGTEFLCTRIGNAWLRKFIAGAKDLLQTIIEAPLAEYFLLTTTENDTSLMATPISLEDISPSLLPAPEYFVDPSLNTLLLQEQRVVIDTALELSEAKKAAVISSYTLAEFLSIFQDLIKFAYKKATSILPPKTRKIVSNSDYYMMQVTDIGVHASFGLRLQSKQVADLSQHVEIERATSKLADILQATNNATNVIDVLRLNKGRLVGAYRRLLDFLIESNADLRLNWHIPRNGNITTRFSISHTQAEKIRAALSQQKDLDDETVNLEGVLTAVNVDTGHWTLTDDESEKHKGQVQAGLEIRLSQLVTDSVRYLFQCKAVIHEDALGNEYRDLFLLHMPTEAPTITATV